MIIAIPEIDLNKCNGCGDCVEQCPNHAVEIIGYKAVIVRAEDCDYCTDCEVLCPPGAIRCPFEILLVWAEAEMPPEEPKAGS